MQLELFFRAPQRPQRRHDANRLLVGSQQIRLWFFRHRKARRYVLRLRADGSARVTIPRGGSLADARQFAEKNSAWLEKQLLRHAARSAQDSSWRIGSEVWFRGERVRLTCDVDQHPAVVRFAGEVVPVIDPNSDLRPAVESHLQQLARRELTARAHELATFHGIRLQRVTVRNQRSRWGSCSTRGTISLNWRLLQTPLFVRDYIILHEFAHLKQMNHSRRFWREVERLCPDYFRAEQWLKKCSKSLLW